MKATLYGVSGNLALFDVDGSAVIVHTKDLTAHDVSVDDVDTYGFWEPAGAGSPIDSWAQLAACRGGAEKSDVTVTAAVNPDRSYTIPKAVRDTAWLGLQTDGPHTAVGTKVATMLASGGQVSFRDVLFVSRFHARNEPENTHPARYQAWGGDPGRRWALGISDKYATLVAALDVAPNLEDFCPDCDDNDTQFYGATSDQGDTCVTLYKMTPSGTWQAWGDGVWFDSQDPDCAEGKLLQLDDETAIYVAGALFEAPDTDVPLGDYDPDEWQLVQEALPGLDWNMMGYSMNAAGPPTAVPSDHMYTPQERSKNASAQLRDANGRFATVGDSGVMSSGVGATIERVDASTGKLLVNDTNGNKYLVPANTFKVGGTATSQPPKPSGAPDPTTGTPGSQLPPLDLDEILAEPRATKTTPKAWLKHLLQPMGPAQLKKVVDDYSDFIHSERQRRGSDFNPQGGFLPTGGRSPRREEKIEDHLRKEIHRNESRARSIIDRIHHAHGENAVDGIVADGGDVLDQTPGAEQPGEERPTPENSDVKPIYLAIVDHDDPKAVTDLVALVPADNTSDQPTLFRRVAGDWVEDVKLLQDIRSPTPPPVVQLEGQDYADVLNQVDNATAGEDPSGDAAPQATAASGGMFGDDSYLAWGDQGQLVNLIAVGEGGLDRNRGGAEKLRRYWLYGPGALKVRWNTPGDWTRCYRHLMKYLGPRAKGYCALRHHEATGRWTGEERGHEGVHASAWIKPTVEQVITAAGTAARAQAAQMKVYGVTDVIPQSPEDVEPGLGRQFSIPLLIPEGLESGDGRSFEKGALGVRTLPLPLLWQVATDDGHDTSYIVGRIDHVERTDDGLGNATGYFDVGPYGQEAQRLVENGMLRWVSADLDRFEAKEIVPEHSDEAAEDGTISTRKISVTKGRLIAATLVAKPAFQECTIKLSPLEEEIDVPDGTYVGEPDPQEAESLVASAGIAEAIPVEPPSVWFDRPVLNGVTPITVTDEGQVYGHIATWDRDHIGLPRSTRAPRSYSQYAYFHTGALRCEDGKDVHVGQLTLAGGHADMYADASSAVRHYDDTGSSIADVHVGEDGYGIWCAGALRPGTTPEQIRALRASAPSGDWRNINGRLELVAICQVNVPGFPVPRAQVASGAVCALVAAGAQVLARMQARPMDELSSRIERLEQYERRRDELRASALQERMAPALTEHKAKLDELDTLAAAARTRVYHVLDIDGYLTEFKDFSPDKRKTLAKDKKALPDGSFPIENTADLRRAVHAYGRASEDKKARVRRHIARRARALGKPEMIPGDWSENAITDLALSKMDAEETITAALTASANQIRARLGLPEVTGDADTAGSE